MLRRRFYKTPVVQNNIIAPSDTQDPANTGYADAVLANKSTNEIIIVTAVNNELDLSSYPSSDYEPIGVVVIPGSHDVYGDGSCGVMSIVPMNYSTPETGGTSEQPMYWGYNSLDISTLTNLNVVAKSTDTSSNDCVGTNSYAYLPSTKFSNGTGDGVAKYYSSNVNSYPPAPSPYLADGSRNPSYYMTDSPSSTLNALADFDGVGNTDKIIANTTADWSGETITNSYNAGNYPAACCCRRFHTTGTAAGDWYLGACGEMGYMFARLKEIQNTINKLISVYGSAVGVQLSSNNLYWSSSEYSSLNARRVNTNSGRVDDNNKRSNYYVRAWLRVGSNNTLVCGDPTVISVSPNSPILPSEAVAGNKVYYSEVDGGLMIHDDASSTYGTPIGVVVVPGSHNVYGDGSCSIISIKSMSCSSPEDGIVSEEEGIYWGGYEVDISTLPNLNVVNSISSVTDNTLKTTYGLGYIPSTNNNGNFTVDSCDSNAKYYLSTASVYPCPSPYNSDGTRNESYYSTEKSTLNALSDFDGWGNTFYIMSKVTADWHGSTIVNSYDEGNYPAACCCKRFHTAGTEAGDWYLGACGEIGYLISRFLEIQDAITLLNTVHLGIGILLSSSSGFLWSSSEVSDTKARTICNYSGGVGKYDKSSLMYVRAFLRIIDSEDDGFIGGIG